MGLDVRPRQAGQVTFAVVQLGNPETRRTVG